MKIDHHHLLLPPRISMHSIKIWAGKNGKRGDRTSGKLSEIQFGESRETRQHTVLKSYFWSYNFVGFSTPIQKINFRVKTTSFQIKEYLFLDQKLNFMIVCGELGARQRQRHFDLSTPRTSLVFLKDKIESERDYFFRSQQPLEKKKIKILLFSKICFMEAGRS